MRSSFLLHHEPSPQYVWEATLTMAQEALGRPGSFKQRIPIVDDALHKMSSVVPSLLGRSREEQVGHWQKGFTLLEKLFRKAPEESAVPPQLTLRALKLWHAVESKQSSPSWHVALRVAKHAFHNVAPDVLSSASRTIIELGTRVEPLHTEQKAALKGTKQILTGRSVPFLPVCQSLDELRLERNVLQANLDESTEKDRCFSSLCFMRMLHIDDTLSLQARLQGTPTMAPSWAESLLYMTRLLASSRQGNTSLSTQDIENATFTFIMQYAPPKAGSVFVQKHYLETQSRHQKPLVSHQSATLAALCSLAAAEDFETFGILLDKIRPSPLKRELGAVFFTGSDFVDSHPQSYDVALHSDRFAKYCQLYEKYFARKKSDPRGTSGSLQPEDIRSAIHSLHAAVSDIFNRKRLPTVRLASLFAAPRKESQIMVADEAAQSPAIQHDPIAGIPCADRSEFVQRSLNRLLTHAIGGNIASSLDAEKIDIQLHQENPVPQYSRTDADLVDSESMLETILIHSRSNAMTIRRRKRSKSAHAILSDALKLNPAAVPMPKILQTLAHLRGGKPASELSVRGGLTVSKPNFWKHMLTLWPQLRQDHPDIRAEMLVALHTKLLIDESQSFVNKCAKRSLPATDEESLWKKAMNTINTDDITSELAPYVLRISMCHPKRWEFALQVYAICSAHGYFNDNESKRDLRKLLRPSDFVHALSLVPKAPVRHPCDTHAPSHSILLFTLNQTLRDRHVAPSSTLNSSSLVDILRCEFFCRKKKLRTHGSASWKLTLQLAVAYPETFLHIEDAAKFALLALAECSSLRYKSISAPTSDKIATVLSAMTPEGSAKCVDPLKILDGLHEIDQIALQSKGKECTRVSETHTDTASSARISIHLLQMIRFVALEMLRASLPSTKCPLISNHYSMLLQQGAQVKRALGMSRVDTSVDLVESQSFILAELLCTALYSIPSSFHRTAARFLGAVHQLYTLSQKKEVNMPNALVLADKSSLIALKEQTLDSIMERWTDESASTAYETLPVLINQRTLPEHTEIASITPELINEQRRQRIKQSDVYNKRLTSIFANEAVSLVLCPPRMDFVAITAKYLADTQEQSNPNEMPWVPQFCPKISALDANCSEESAKSMNGPSMAIFVSSQHARLSESPLALALARHCAQPKPAVHSVPGFIQSARFRYVVFAERLEKAKSGKELNKVWEIDARTFRVIHSSGYASGGPVAICLMQAFLRGTYRIDSILVRVIGTATDLHCDKSFENYDDDLADAKPVESNSSKFMLEVCLREPLTDSLIARILKAIGLCVDSGLEPDSDTLASDTQRDADPLAMVEMRIGKDIFETSLPADIQNHGHLYSSDIC